ncbi:phage tail tape measure protein [Streptomyces sp. NPDC056069]|uniref:phage tail tape measure protein n=1 Tax=Streptomyces sp. NPDC056069 TaxID=3345702 RepID=UPI0035E2AD3D
MANWNLSVDIRGVGNSLSRELRQAATHSRALGANTRTARTQVAGLGRDANAAARHLRSFGSAARTAARDVDRLGTAAQRAGVRLGRYGDAARTSNRHLNALGTNSRSAGRDLARMSGQLDTAVRDLTRLATAAQRAAAQTDRIGARGLASMRRYADETGRLRHQLTGAAALLSGGALVMGGAELVKEGNEYQQAMNTFGAVTDATAVQMRRAALTANQLGNDLSLPGSTATDAAESMVELAKAGFRTEQAISSSRASLVLASAAQVNAADSAKYLGDMMDQFGMGADQAQVAADTLAATANAASGDIIDIYYAMKYAGPVAHGLGVSMQEAATGVGMLGKAGILGQTAGTTLRGIFTNLAKPTPQMKEGLKSLGIEAWNAQGRFKGLRYVVEQLSEAQHNLTQQDFTAAVAKAFGKPAMSGAIALAHQGVDSYDALIQAVSRTGAASDIAAAKGKGLAGAMLQLKTQARQTGLTIYSGAAPGLEYLTRSITAGLADATPRIEQFFQYANDFATLFGPGIAADASRTFGAVKDAAADMLEPFKDGALDVAAAALHVLMTAGRMAVTVLKNLADGAAPVFRALGDITNGSSGAATALDTVVYVLDLAASAVEILSGVLGPVGHMVGGLVSMFGALPGPVQSAVFAMLLMRRVGPVASGLATTVGGRLTGAFRGLGEQMRVQQALATASGVSLSRYGAAFAVLQTRVGVIGQMGASFRTAAGQATGFASTLRGVTAAAGTGLRTAMGGLMGALGGPWGLALTGAAVGLGILASRQQEAAAAAREHENQIANLSAALRESNGIVDENVRQVAMQTLMSTKIKTTLDGQQRLIDVAKQAKIPMADLVDAYTNQGSSLDDLQDRLAAAAEAQKTWNLDAETGVGAEGFTVAGRAADDLRTGIGGLAGDFRKAKDDAQAFADGVAKAGKNTTAYDLLKRSVSQLADKTADADSRTRALREALDLLSGGSVSLQAAQARVNEAVTRANEAMANGIDRSKGYGDALIGQNGTISTVTANGQALFDTYNTIADSSAAAAIAAYDFALSQNQGVPAAIAAAQREMKKGRDAALKVADGYDIGAEAAGKMADSMGLIPGQVSILLQTKGVDTALAELIAVQAEFARVPKEKTVKVDALGADAKRELEAIGYQIELIPGTREYKITAPTAQARGELDLLIQKLASTNGKTLEVKAPSAAAVRELQAIQEKVAATHGKTLTMAAPTAEARGQLEALGFSIRDNAKDKTVTISVPTDSPISAAAAIKNAIDNIHGKSVGIGVYLSATGSDRDANGVPDMIQARATGAVVDYYAGGGIRGGREDHVAQIAPAGSWRVWGEPETGGEAYVPLAPAKRPRSRAIVEETVKRLGGDPAGIQWNASGSVTDWRYDPQTGALFSPSDAGQAAHRIKKVKVKGKVQEVEFFDLGALERKLKQSSAQMRWWQGDLAIIAERAGSDVAQALASMGADGVSLTKKMARGSTKYVNEMASALRGLAATAKVSLTDYTRSLNAATTADSKFAQNLATLAARGYGDLARQLAAQGDDTAVSLAASAVADNRKAGSANAAAKKANAQLTGEQVQQLVAVIAAISSSKTGLHDVAETTGLGEDDIIDIATKASVQIKTSLGSRATKFLADLARAQKGLSYANGGIREGIYATTAGAVTFAEPLTGGEAFVPLGAHKRRQALPVLAEAARRHGVGLTDLRGSQQVVVLKDAGDTTINVSTLRTGATARDIASEIDYQQRRARRGGVAARA